MKKMLKVFTLGIIAMSILACQGKKEDVKKDVKMIEIKVSDEKGEMVDIKVPQNPKKIVLADYLAMDQVMAWNVDKAVVGMSKSALPSHLKELAKRNNIKNVGTLHEIDMEEIMGLEPDIIFTSGRGRKKYKELSKIAPTVMTMIDYKQGNLESFKELTRRNAKIFGKEEAAEKKIAEYSERIAKIKEKAEGKTAVIGIIIGGGLKTLGNTSRGSIIGTDMGFENILADKNSTHGNLSSFELLLKADPDYIFIINKDVATGKNGAKQSSDIMDNEIVHKTKAYQNGNIVYLSSDAWYLSEGGIMTMDIMLKDIEKALNINN